MSIVTKARRKELIQDQRFLDLIKIDRLSNGEYIEGECLDFAFDDVNKQDQDYGQFCAAFESVIGVVLNSFERRKNPKELFPNNNTDWGILKTIRSLPGSDDWVGETIIYPDNFYFSNLEYFVNDSMDELLTKGEFTPESFTKWSDAYRNEIAADHRKERTTIVDEAEMNYSCLVMTMITDNGWLKDHAKWFLKRDETPFMRNIITEYEAAA